MTAIFVTGTGTDVGKTFVTAGLIHHLRAEGRTVEALKPVVSGFDAAAPAASDPGRLLAALGAQLSDTGIARISPWRFSAPLSPDMAAKREGRAVDFSALVEACRTAVTARRDIHFVEGVGGIMVPLNEHHTVLDWMVRLRLPVLLVTASALGTISHTLTALDVLARRKLNVAAVAVSESAMSTVPLDETVASIARFATSIEVIAVPRLPAGETRHEAFGRIAKKLLV